MKLRWFYLAMCLFSLGAKAQVSDFTMPIKTRVQQGWIEGNFDTQTGIKKYFGIPFAQAPVGDLRWKVPQPLGPWEGVKITKKFGPRPVQAIVFGDMHSRSAGMSEDCLYLNVWTPAKRNDKNLPVLVYFYGGGNVAGDASEPRYDGESMAKKGVVVVTCNYRLNIFGNFAHPELSVESAYKGSGNYGYYDQLAALRWVKENIAAFGGDPGHVTIAGESAGSVAVSYQMASPLSKGLVHAAIGESGAGIHPTMAPMSLKEAEQMGLEFSQKAGVPSIKALRALSTAAIFEIYQESKRFGFPVVVDGHFLPKTLVELFQSKQQHQIPLLMGWNSAEVGAGAFMQGKAPTAENFKARVQAEYGAQAAEALALYPHATDQEALVSATHLASDRFIVYASWKWFDLHRKHSDQPVYRYLYSKFRPPLVDQNLSSGLAGGTVRREGPAPIAPPPVGAPHACEIEYCMGNLHLVKDYAWTAEDYKVSETMFNYFTNFVKTYNPNGPGLPVWEAAKGNQETPPVMVIDVQSRTEPAKQEGRFQWLDKQYQK